MKKGMGYIPSMALPLGLLTEAAMPSRFQTAGLLVWLAVDDGQIWMLCTTAMKQFMTTQSHLLEEAKRFVDSRPENYFGI